MEIIRSTYQRAIVTTAHLNKHQHEHLKHMGHGANKDPVCGMDVGDDATSSDFDGETYRFCSDSCKESFDQDPGKYVGD